MIIILNEIKKKKKFHFKFCFISSLKQALIERLGKTAYPFSLEVASLAPPSVQLVPAKRYTGAPIGTSYDIRVHLGKKYGQRTISTFSRDNVLSQLLVTQCNEMAFLSKIT